MNVSSRLESSGVLGRIQVTEQVAQILDWHGEFEVECRGPIEVKGKGLLTTYLVVTPYDSVSPADERAAGPVEGDALEVAPGAEGQADGCAPLDEGAQLGGGGGGNDELEEADCVEPPPELVGDEIEELGART